MDKDDMTLRLAPSIREIMSAARDFSAKTEYPIKDFDQFEKALGGDTAAVTLLGETYKASELRDIIPPECFPVESEEDLVMKVASGYFSLPHITLESQVTGKKLDAPPEGITPPPSDPPADAPKSGDLPLLIGRKRE
jgi:hypothetical protein